RRHIFAYLLTQFFRRFDAAVATPNPLAVLSSVKSFFREAIARVGHIDVAVVDLIEKVLRLDAKQETMCQAFIAWLVDVALTDQALTQEFVALIHDTAFGKADMEEIVENCWMNIEKISSSVKTQLDYLEGELNKERQKPEAAWDRGLIKALEYQKKDLESESLLSYLAEQQFLPRYGFPIQVVPLVERWEDYDEDRTPEHPRLRLDRDVALALNEYAPGAEVVAGKHVHVSRGLLRHWTGEDAPGVLATRFVALCSNCGQAQYARNQGEIRNPCPTCRQVDPRQIPVVNPKLGFAVQWGTRPKRWAGGVNSALRPVTEAVYAAREGDRASEVCQGLALAYDEEGEVLVRTEGSLVESDLSGASASSAPIGARREGYGYAICYLCGRAEPETAMPTTGKNNKQIDPLPELLRGHQRLRGKGTCEAKTHYWRHMSLAGALRTETLRTELRGRLALPSGEAGVRLATTWMVALQLASGEVLGVDSREIGGLLSPRQSGADYVYDIILYDQVAGGVGHCRALLDRWEDLMSAARRRLTCPNPACTNACHRCLLAFESQRYEPLLRRRRLLEFLDPGWALLQQKVERDNIPVMPVFRGGSEVREYLARSPFAEVTIVASHLGPGAMADGGWLRWLLRHADGQGKVRLVLDKLPNPDSDEERITALRLRISMEMGKVSVHVAPAGAAASFSWPISASGSGSGDVYSVEASNGADPLGSSWIGPASRVFRASGPTAVVDARGRVEHLVGASKLCAAVVLEPKHVAPAIVVHNIPALAMGAQATFAYWFKNARNELLNARSLRSVTIVDPYLQTDWQVTLLEDVARFFKANGCRQMDVVTYAPAPEKENWGLGVNRTLSATDQRRRITVASGNAAWKPREEPTDKLLRLHQRYIEGLREDGTRFVVFMERGLDFIVLDRSRQTRTTRPSYIVVKEE
ncbi:MAG: DUF1998 domain-containing protein, partial [Polyangiaceae bacterium]|nr:DUF1998 domain-containing protein [Polyangiaceae bacterium]